MTRPQVGHHVMHRGHIAVHDILLLVVSAVACTLPTPWLSLPGALVLVLWLPGRAVVRLLAGVNNAPGRPWLALAASLVFVPVLLAWVYEFTNSRWAILVAMAVTDLLLLTRPVGHAPTAPVFSSRSVRCAFGAMVFWIAACVFASFWLPHIAGGVTVTPAHDYIKHHAVMLSLEQHSLPLHNVFYAAESSTPYFYYHYYYLLPAAIRALTGNSVSIPLAFGLTSAVLAVVFITLVFLLARDVLGSERGALLSAACVSIVGGFDIIPVLVRLAGGGGMVVTLDAWCPVAWRIHNLATQYFWCPQHVSAALALLLCAHWLGHAPDRPWWVIIAPLAAAPLFGSSVYLAMTVFPAAMVFAVLRVRSLASSDRLAARRTARAIAAMALLGGALMGLQACHYYLMSGRYAGGLTVRWDRFPLAALGRLVPPGPIANLLDAPWILLIDLGLPAIACLLVARRCWSRLWAHPGLQLLALAGVVGVAAWITVRSDVNTIDYGFRIAVKPAMVLAAVCAGALLAPELVRPFAQRWRWPVIAVGVLLGLPVGGYEAPATAARRLIERRGGLVDAGALAYLRSETPPDAVVQGDPRRRLDLAALVDRQLGVLDPDCAHVAVFQPLDPGRMRRALADVEQAFATASSGQAWEDLDRWGIQYVLAGSIERKGFGAMPQFNDPRRFEIVYAGEAASVYRLLKPVAATRTETAGDAAGTPQLDAGP